MRAINKGAGIVAFALTLIPLLTGGILPQVLQQSNTITGMVNQRPPLKKEASVSERDAIYSAAINYLYDKVYAKRGVELIVFSDETEDQQKLKRQLNLRTKYALAPKRSLDALLYNPDKDAFFNRYKTAPGYMVLSGISFNENDSQAKLNIGLECGFLCGIGWYFKLSKADGTWAVEEQKVSWQK